MLRRMLLVAGIVLMAWAPAAAAQYADDGSLTIDEPSPDPGDTVNLSLTGCGPNEEVTVTISQGGQTVNLGTFTTDGDGNLNDADHHPAGLRGRHGGHHRRVHRSVRRSGHVLVDHPDRRRR